ncbi:MAG: iron-sulfur cluster assembly scaffold protein [Verrucomicrobia bacterium]|nr:iron-sulfur cluster assembly scaffold protein [Verrucomicrobiota bacterium]
MISYPWTRYSKKLASRIDTPRWAGSFTEKDTEGRDCRLVIGEEGEVASGNFVRFYWLVDEREGLVLDAKHQTFGQSALIGAAEAACELCCGKNYDQASRLGADLIDKHLRDRPSDPAFPVEVSSHLNLVVDAIDAAASKCRDLPLPTTYVTPLAPELDVLEGGYPGFMEMPKAKKMSLIRQVIASEVQPYIELDAGGISVLDLVDDKEVLIAYEGSCTTCASSTGTTLSYIQQVVQARVHPDLVVVPQI